MGVKSFFDAAPVELERAVESLSLATTRTAPLVVPPSSSSSLPSSPSMQQQVTPPPPSQQDAPSPSIPSRLLSSLPSYLLPAFLGGGGGNGRGTFKPLKQHTVRLVSGREERRIHPSTHLICTHMLPPQ